MLRSMTVINPDRDLSVSVPLAQGTESGLLITGIDGIGPSKAAIVTKNNVLNDGSVYNMSRLEQRNVVVHLAFVDSDISVEERRLRTYELFPVKEKVRLLFDTDFRKLWIEGYVESNEPEIFSSMSSTTISIVCPDPHFYGVTEHEYQEVIFSYVSPSFEFPFEGLATSTPSISFGERVRSYERTITYNGDYPTGIVIELTADAPVELPVIKNVQNDSEMVIDTDKIEAITGYSFDERSSLIIDTRRGYRSVTFAREGQKFNVLSALKDVSVWHNLERGDNVFAISATEGGREINAKILYREIFAGV